MMSKFYALLAWLAVGSVTSVALAQSGLRAGASPQALTQQREADKAGQQQIQIERERCAELRRILDSKRQRTLSEGERADQQRFEETYRGRCKQG
jgi:hypothetical protein